MIDERKQVADFERLDDERFPWVDRRRKAMRLAEIYHHAGYEEYAARAGTCATWLQFNAMFDGSRTLGSANFCQLRLCPMCTARRAHKAAYKLNQVMNVTEAERGCRYIFLTLTVENCIGCDLGKTIGQLTKGWYRLVDQRPVGRAVKGWFRAVEITRNSKNGTYHPHLHAILAVSPEYFDKNSPLFITQKQWRQRWAKAARLDYDPRVDIRTTHEKRPNFGEDGASRGATLEAAKYATKDSEYIDPDLSLEEAAEIVTDYTQALHRRRLTAYGGWLKEVAQRLGADDLEDDTDLVHIDDEAIRDDLADMIETYHWHLGAGDYILARRELNPLKVQRVDPETGEVIM